jgi:hypothetical protein
MRDLMDWWNSLQQPGIRSRISEIDPRIRRPQDSGGRNSLRFQGSPAGNRCLKSLKVAICLMGALSFSAEWSRGTSEDPGEREPVQLETRQAIGLGGPFQISRLIHKLAYGGGGERGFRFRSAEEEAVEEEISSLMREFGAEDSTVPAAFVRDVHRFIKQYQGRDRALISQVLVRERARLDQVRRILRRDRLPEDLAYMILVESRFLESAISHEGAAGFWQFTETTAREYGMEVNDQVDERLDLAKSTEAASRYLRDLILEFGNGNSLMLAIAAYNSGAETVHRAIRGVKEPIQQHNSWQWFDSRALPAETRAYVPKVIAAILVGRNPQRFGF